MEQELMHQLQNTIHYINDQQKHHKRKTFEEEYLSFLKKHGIKYDVQYIWG